ncbi:VOC family protein [Sphingomonas parva]|uniref:VOC family protein n=1 Tax=Sphingomonas parva TaxID=2555898 RepID=A0A4Y8ZP40_9SPHN|nr:VOC family protein [Sphingomonas parva]TFI56589.1 VOC family protein [Sphingomonas parva]
MPVVGLGGLMFRARDPEKLKAWYRTQLGIGGGCVSEGGEQGWRPGTGPAPGEQGHQYMWYPAPGPMVFDPFEAESDRIAADRNVLINLRVRDMEGLLAQLRAAGTEIASDDSYEGVGRFARIHDPEGNPLELWEPPAA